MRSRLGTLLVILLVALGVTNSASALDNLHVSHHATGSSVTVEPASVPWGEVGPGWELVSWEPHPHAKQNVNYIELVSPYGSTYAVYATGPGTHLVAWAGDRTDALLQTTSKIEVLNLQTGTIVDAFGARAPAGASINVSSFTWPHGLALYLYEATGNYLRVDVHPERTSLSGTVEMRYPGSEPAVGTFNGSMLSSADGTHVVFGAERGLALFDNDGVLAAQLVFRQARECSPDFYWSPTEVLADCVDGDYQRLIIFSLVTGKWWAIDRKPRGNDLGDIEAWRGGSTIYVEVTSACGYAYVATLQGDAPVYLNVPGIQKGTTDSVVDTTSTSVLIQAEPSCVPGRAIYDWFTPSTGSVRQILGPPITGGWTIADLPYPATPSGSPPAFADYY